MTTTTRSECDGPIVAAQKRRMTKTSAHMPLEPV